MSVPRLSLFALLWLGAMVMVLGPDPEAGHAASATVVHRHVRSGPQQRETAAGRAVSIELGPLRLASGGALMLDEQDCGTADGELSLTFLDGPPTARISHSFSGLPAACAITPRQGVVTLRARAGGAVAIDLRIVPHGRREARPAPPFGCGPGRGPVLAASATGQLAVAIHVPVYGTVRRTRLSGRVYRGGLPPCPAPDPRAGSEITATVGADLLDVNEPPRAAPTLQIIDTGARDAPAGLSDLAMLTLAGRAAVGPGPSRPTVRLGSSTRFSGGALSFSPLPACPGARAVNGTLSGTLSVKDPLLGIRSINGAAATEAYAGPAGAMPGTCNGPGSQPVEPDLVSTCDQPNAGCSLSAHTASATLFDETSAGTQTITSESVVFGDGSPPVPISHLGAVQHTYAAAGRYTATLSVTDAMGTTQTTTAPVVIEP